MAETAQAGSTRAPATVPLYCAVLHGRLVGKARTYQDRDGGKRYAHLVRLPAPDEWSSASTVEVQSASNLGVAGDDVKVVVRISGTVRSFTYRDKATGEELQGQDVNIRLTVVD